MISPSSGGRGTLDTYSTRHSIADARADGPPGRPTPSVLGTAAGAADLHLDRAARPPLRRAVGDEPGRTRRPKMTMEVYAQLQQRVRREHGWAFDAVVRQSRGR